MANATLRYRLRFGAIVGCYWRKALPHKRSIGVAVP